MMAVRTRQPDLGFIKPMVIERRNRSEHGHRITVLYLEGLAKLGESAFFFQGAVENVIRNADVVVDFTKLDLIDSTGIGELVGILATLLRPDRKLVVVNPWERVNKLIETAKQSDHLEVYSDEETAVASIVAHRAGTPLVPDAQRPSAKPVGSTAKPSYEPSLAHRGKATASTVSLRRMDPALGERVVEVGQLILDRFTQGNWEEIGLLTGYSDHIREHPRLLRSLSFRDDDYHGHILAILRQMADADLQAFRTVETYVRKRFGDWTEFASTKPSARRITFLPTVFSVPEVSLERDLVAIMMPLAAEYTSVYKAITTACQRAGFRPLRADDIWDESVIMQDIFNLIFRAHVVVVDLSGKNPNVMYEMGIAHTLGKHVIPISQSIDDGPFDIKHHRILKYLSNAEGLEQLETRLAKRLQQFATIPPSIHERS
jgi:anti-anti-sigma factor